MSATKTPSPADERASPNPDSRRSGQRPLIIADVRPEVVAGGIVRDDGEIAFYVRVNALLRPEMTVLDFGAGRGAVFSSNEVQLREKLCKLQGKVRKVIGVDVDDGILQHPYLDERYLMKIGGPIPVDDASIDLAVAHWVFEHVQDPSHLAAELFRILKPGGWICARTPHRWSYVGVASSLLPHGVQSALLRWIKPSFPAEDKFPTVYKLNSFHALRKYFPDTKWLNCSYGVNSTPRYYFENRLVFKILSAYQTFAWPKTDIIVLVQKRAGALRAG
ncbi:MAG TPA: methyltransferase domain-containing protein [Xanthobacteraceae bacterium]|nr:methyltransferase domain-containing protein [Xanthobacteraceae bacterium]